VGCVGVQWCAGAYCEHVGCVRGLVVWDLQT
jgi:hypothetical protein